VALLALSLLKASAFDPATLSIEQLKNGIENQHPAYFYYLAKKLFTAGQNDDAVIAWDQSHNNALTPRAQHKSQYDQIVSGLTEMRDQVLQQADSIRKTRTANGLPNRN
jgi:hypothetical protein